ncbi:peptidoglycan recognition protein [Streptomyces sp. TRM72054]|uniref:peptidoglycan recognition protein family protein n=1 Tax=Streptomyces sp. TRM72054 TaxID=2870562 RepID=UPI001C8C654F|nr:peptidoglycan recognition protein [Streptomyces sp. TRM72054]MBX9398646.1 peptidoglycan recognition protein [Streptomyces sp. TRM72054]
MSSIGNMRGFLASSIGLTCAAALALPLTLPATTATAATALPAASAGAGTTAADPSAQPGIPGSTQSLPLVPLSDERAAGAPGAQGLPRQDVRRFSLVGVVWDDPDTELHGRVQVRTRAAGTGAWSGWQDVETHNADHGPDPGTPEHSSGRLRGATAPLWVGDSDGVEVRVLPEASSRTPAPLPSGLRLELVDPGRADTGAGAARGADDDPPLTGPLSAETAAASEVNALLAPIGATEIPALDRADTEDELFVLRAPEMTAEQLDKPYIGPRPGITTRRGWGADENLREKEFLYTKQVKVAFVHHTATGNNYTCAEAPSVIRSIYRYHVVSMGWRDIGYNFLVDKCGNIYEGRAGGVAEPVMGAHTLGFNHDSMGIAVLGTFDSTAPPTTSVTAVGQLTAWKLGLFGGEPGGTTYLKSGGGNLYKKDTNVRLNVISGHKDGFLTDCPGQLLYGKLGSVRSEASRLQGRP